MRHRRVGGVRALGQQGQQGQPVLGEVGPQVVGERLRRLRGGAWCGHRR